VPAHLGDRRGDRVVLATSHTHPNTGQESQQEPRLTDIRGVRDDPELVHPEFEGEFVISSDWVYLIRKSGRIKLVGATIAVLGIT
jgi:hypothetical protein